MSNQREIIAINKAEINKLKRDLSDLMYKSPKGANNKKSLSTMKSNENLLPSISGNGTTRTTQRIIFTSNKKANNIYKSQHSLSSLSLNCESKFMHNNVNTPNVNRMYSSNNLFLYGNELINETIAIFHIYSMIIIIIIIKFRFAVKFILIKFFCFYVLVC